MSGIAAGIRLDEKDRKILLELDTDSRQGLGQIAKKLRTSKEVVAYRIRQLERQNVIENYTAMYHPLKLGLMYFKLYIKLAHITEEKRREITEFISQKKNFNWLASSEGSFDLMIGVHFSSVLDFEKYRDELFRKFGGFFQKSSYAILTEGEAYPRQYIAGVKNPRRKVFLFCSPAERENMDAEDVAIVRALSLNSRAPITEIARNAGVTPAMVRYRKKFLEKRGVIAGYKVFINYRKLGHMMFKCLVKLESADDRRFHDLRLYARQSPHVIYWMKVLGEWDIELDIEVLSIEEFYRIAHEIRSRFSDIVQNFDTLLVLEDFAMPHN